MWQGRRKAITFSFDDGVTQDEKVIKILDDYGLKGTFNLNSGKLGLKGELDMGEKIVSHNKFSPERIQDMYKNHEVAAHAVNHPALWKLSEEEIIQEIEEDREALKALVGYDICGMAYPYGYMEDGDRVANIVAQKTKIRYARTVNCVRTFERQSNLIKFNPTMHFLESQAQAALIEEFLNMQAEEDKILYIWGHAYELDYKPNAWEEFEKLCKKISGKSDVFYGTNKQVLLF